MRIALLAAAALAATAPLAAFGQEGGVRTVGDALGVIDPSARLAQVLADSRRAQDKARDQDRHPRETLEFFQVKPGMTVVDYLPAGGWFTRIIAPYLGSSGHYIAMGPNLAGETNQYFLNSMGGLAEKFPGQAAGWNLGSMPKITAFNTDGYPESLDGTVDRVLIFRELHNQLRFGWLHDDMLAIRRMLKPGGMLGIEDHRMFENAPYAMTDGSKGYLRESDVIALMNVYGFDLVARSEINANPKDTKDYPGGVWTLPPGLRGATEANRAQLQAIGESDRMTLLFRKRD